MSQSGLIRKSREGFADVFLEQKNLAGAAIMICESKQPVGDADHDAKVTEKISEIFFNEILKDGD